ncbi:MAG: penicillin-binding transpeptidase domain-containing protein [Pseudomonadota bacterium]
MIINVKNGEVLAATSLPDFDPNSANTNPNASNMFNRVTLGVYELGSTFKIFTTAALLEQKHPLFSQKFDATHPIVEGGHTIHDYHAENKFLTLPEVFMVSSNIGTARMAQEIGTNGLKSMFDELGLLKKPDFEIEEVGSPIIPKPWREINTLTASYGHGIAVSPLQLMGAVSDIVNGGYKIYPKLVMNADKAKATNSNERIISTETSLKMRQLLRLVVSEGTARKANISGYYVGGKTGTAEKNINGKYTSDKNIAIFVGAFPIDNPMYAVMVLVDEPHPNKSSYGYATAGWVAAPAVGRIVTSMGSLLGMQPHTDTADIAEPLKQFISDVKGEH